MAVMHYQSGLKMRAHKAKSPFISTHEVEWDPAWLIKPANEYNPKLAIASLCLALSACENLPSNDYRYILDTLASFGMHDVDISSYYHRNQEDLSDFEKTVNLVAYAFALTEAKDENGSEIPIVVCIPRATSPTIEWNSNADVADAVTDGNYGSVEYHEGFLLSEREMLDSLKSYIRDKKIDETQARFLVVGHSRGACIANILGADLDRAHEFDLSIKPEQVYVYTFASSGTTLRKDANDELYGNIFNVVHPEDFIPRVPISMWGFKRFGITYYLPSIATNYSLFSEICDSIYARFELIADTEMLPFHGFNATNAFVRDANNLADSVEEYYTKKHIGGDEYYTFREYFELFTNECATSGLENLKVTVKMLDASKGAYESFLSYFFEHEVLKMQIPYIHSAEAYIARLETLESKDIEIAKGAQPDIERVSFFGPVDIEVYDSSENLIGRIRDGKCDKSLYGNQNSIAVAIDKRTDAKSAWIPLDSDVKVLISPYGRKIAEHSNDSTIDVYCTIARQACEGGVIVQESREEKGLNFDEKLTWNFEKLELPPLDSKLNTGMALERASEASPKLNVVLHINGNGDAIGINDGSKGDIVCIRAFDDGLSHFKGWFDVGEDGKPKDDLKDGLPVSRDKKFVFHIEEHPELEARFGRI